MIEIEGLESQLRIRAADKLNNQSRDNSPTGSSPSQTSLKRNQEEYPGLSDVSNFSVKDLYDVSKLAQSFLDVEPEEEKSELEAAILSETPEVEIGTSSIISDDGEVYTGMGTALTLPKFMSRFIQGILDRIQIKILDISAVLDIHVPSEGSNLSSPFETIDPVTLKLTIYEVDVKGVGQNLRDADLGNEYSETVCGAKKRIVCFSKIRGYLISEANIFPTPANSTPDKENNQSLDSSSIISSDSVSPTHSTRTISLKSHQPVLKLPLLEKTAVGNSYKSSQLPTPPSKPLLKLSQSRISQSLLTLTGSNCYDDLFVRHQSDNANKSSEDRKNLLESDFSTSESSKINIRDDSPSGVFSHGEAESMYLSAISHESSLGKRLWELESPTTKSATPIPPLSNLPLGQTKGELFGEFLKAESICESLVSPIIQNSEFTSQICDQDLEHSFTQKKPSSPDVDIYQEPLKSPGLDSMPDPELLFHNEPSQQIKKLFDLDRIRVYIPSTASEISNSKPEIGLRESVQVSAIRDKMEASSVDLPGKFSAYKSVNEAYLNDNIKKSPLETEHSQASSNPHIDREETRLHIGSLMIEFDLSIGRLILKIARLLRDVLNQDSPSKIPQSPDLKSTSSNFTLNMEKISIIFLEHLNSNIFGSGADPDLMQSSGDILLQTSLIGLQFNTRTFKNQKKTSMSLKKFIFGYKDETILSFNSNDKLGSSVKDLKTSADIDFSALITQTPDITRYEVNTLPVNISINLQKLDETFGWLGGLSSVLNLGSSFASSATVAVNSPKTLKARGVRFENQIPTDDVSALAQKKSDIRLGGFKLDLIGSECGLRIITSAIKIVSRDEGIGISIQSIKLSGPHFYLQNNVPAITVEINSTRVEVLPSPKNSDLERLLSLITPSKFKYGQDDDIILDTLLHQRDKGAVVRLIIDSIKTHAANINELSYLPELGEEVSKLATVAKYLPDDDRPGVLSLILIRKAELELDSSHALGELRMSLLDLEAAQITFPSLLAITINIITVSRNNNEILLESLSDKGHQNPAFKGPVLMARMIGDEMEPAMKVKLCFLNFEYRLSTISTLIEFFETITSRDPSHMNSKSVTKSSKLSQGQEARPDSPTARIGMTSNSVKLLAINIALNDCTIGFNPQGLASKLLLGLAEAHLDAALSKDEDISASIELKRSSMLIIDNVANLNSNFHSSIACQDLDSGSSQVTRLCSMGYVSIGYISTVKISLHTKMIEGERTIDLEVCDELFVLESCADSTQTLINVLNALIPKTPPSNDVKYRTKVIPVHDLLASLSTDAFGTAEGDYNFDHDFGLVDDNEADPLHMDYEEGEDFGFESQFFEKREDLYLDEADHSNLIARDTGDGVLLESLQETDDLEDATELEFQENHFAESSFSEGDGHRWNSTKNTYEKLKFPHIRKTPLKVRVHDFHITWNLFDGYDWQNTRDTITKAFQNVTSKAAERKSRNERSAITKQDLDDDENDASVIEDFLFNSIYIGVPVNRDPRELVSNINRELNDNATDTDSVTITDFSNSSPRLNSDRKQRAGSLVLNRSKHHKITFDLRGISVNFLAFSSGSGETQSSMNIRIHDFEIFDYVPTSTWKKFATYMQDAGERETDSNMIHIEIQNVKPVAELAASEIVLKATILPLRLHVDQDALDFITRFFEFKDTSAQIPVSSNEEAFIQRVEVNSVKIKLDFKPKRVDYAGLRSGHTTEFMNFLILDAADIELRHTIIYGISGFLKLGRCLNDIWMPDVKRNQLPGILAGLAPVRPLVNVGGGFRHLVLVPIREYKKDGRIIRSISKGAAVFARTTGTELVKLGAKMAIGVQTVLQGAEGLFGISGDSYLAGESSNTNTNSRQISLYANQPVGVLQGLRGGYNGLHRDLIMARDAIIAVSGEVIESGTAVGAFKAVGRYAPTVILRPAIGVAKAGGQILMGATNSLDPVNLQRAEAVSSLLSFLQII